MSVRHKQPAGNSPASKPQITLSQDLSVYVHWPWCRRICPYCDFNVRPINTAVPDALAKAVCTDISYWQERIGPRRVVSVFFGGGTPSTAPARCLEQILNTIDKRFGLTSDVEISIEANPNDWQGYADLTATGVNRISVGVQSLNDDELRFLGRDHDANTARCAVNAARTTGARISLDAIYALPDQTIESWKQTLEALTTLNAEHLSLYQLTVSPETAFGRRARRGIMIPMPDDTAAELYEITQSITYAAGLPAYEISNHASNANARSRHNLVYWKSGDWLGVGPGAHGRLTLNNQRMATLTHSNPQQYMRRVKNSTPSAHTETTLDAEENAIEHIVCGLRLCEGIELPATLDTSSITCLKEDNLLEKTPNRLTLTPRGRLLADHVCARLCSELRTKHHTANSP